MAEATTSNANNNSVDTFTKGLLNLVKPVVVECDTRMQAVFTSQTQLSDQIDELSAELERFLTVSHNPSPTILPYVQTLIRAKQRLTQINGTLNVVRERLDRMEKMVNPDQQTSKVPEVFSSILGRIRTNNTSEKKATSEQAPASTEPVIDNSKVIPIENTEKTSS